MEKLWKLSPSDFAFLWEECPRCFYQKIVWDFRRPMQPMPSIFSVIDGRMKDCFLDRPAAEIAPGTPAGKVLHGEKWVESTPLSFPETESRCFLKGKIDTVLQLDDDTYAVVDFKTSTIKPEQVAKYSRQLHAYAYALENSAPGKFSLKPITRLGLLVYQPDTFRNPDPGKALLEGKIGWIEIPRNPEEFLKFLEEVMAVLDRPEPPKGSGKCGWCRYRAAARWKGKKKAR